MDDLNKIAVAIGLIIRDNHVLIGKRTSGFFSGLWEFPGGKIEPNEASHEALVREMHEELGIQVTDSTEVIHIQEKQHKALFHLQIWHIHSYDDKIVANEQQHLQWAPINALEHIDLIPTNIPIIHYLQQTYLQTADQY